MSDKMALINNLKEEGYSVEHYKQGEFKITDPEMKGWAVYIKDGYFGTELKLILTSQDGFQSKAYDEGQWKDALNDLFFMYHCMQAGC